MPLRDTVARMGAATGDRLSNLLHTLVFSLPTPDNVTGSAANATTNATGTPVPTGISVKELDSGLDPGVSRALATGTVGPLSFVGSGYGMMLVVMAILLNRIHHIVQRPRPPPPPLPHPPTTWYGAWRLRVARTLVSPNTPRWLRVPGLLGLVRAWVLFSVVTLQTGEMWPLDATAYLDKATQGWYLQPTAHLLGTAIDHLGVWADNKEMGAVCWNTFLSVCAGLVCGALANGLDRARRRDVGAGFNLFGFSFLLHLYSSPLTHKTPSPAAHYGRPDVHALFHLWLGLTELTWLQAIELSPTLRRNQLLPTGACGALGLIHFVFTLMTSPLRFPSFTFVTHLLALLLSIIIICTIILRAFTHLFTLGYIPSPVWSSLLPHEGAIPSTEDDAGVALLKLGTACIEATSYSGLRNELAPVEQSEPWVQLSVQGCEQLMRPQHLASGGLDTRIDNIQVTELTDPNADSPFTRELHNFRKAVTALVSDVFWTTVLGTPIGRKAYLHVWRAYHARWWYGPRQWQIWRRAAWAAPHRRREAQPPFLTPTAIAAMGWSSAIRPGSSMSRRALPVRSGIQARAASVPADYTYDQVLRGEVVLEDDDDEYEWESHASGSDDEDDLEIEELDERERGRDGSTTPSPRDRLATPQVDPEAELDDTDPVALQPILLAHMTTTTSSPMTRRRYQAMMSSHNGTGDAFQDMVLRRRNELVGGTATQPHNEWDEERRRSCVVCMVQTRDIILWPCRCMLMCNDCRESLAARLTSKEQACPNCRTKVEGYSRVYLP